MSDDTNASWLTDIPRDIFGALNNGIYSLIVVVYKIFFNVASAELFTNETIRNFYSRVQLIIGVFMIFRLTITVLQGIVNPDKFTDSKTGIGNIITRMITSLALLTMLVPITIPKSNPNSFERHINNNGLLFGVLYDLQDRILMGNTLGKLILGTQDTSEATQTSMEESGNLVASTILKGFLRPNLIDDTKGETNTSNWYCNASNYNDSDDIEFEKLINNYKKDNISPSTLLSSSFIDASCDIDGMSWFGVGDQDRYVFSFNWFISLVVGVIFLIVLLGFCIEVAKRAIKIAILRLIAPIPIISYMDPKAGGEGGAFNSWVKTLSSTYLDLFIQLSIIYFVIFMIQDMMKNGIIITEATGVVGTISVIFIWIGLFLFAKDAPKFIKQALGIKDNGGGGWFKGALGIGAGALGLAAAARTNWKASSEENDELHPGQSVRNFGRNLGSALIGGMAGMATATNASLNAKDHGFKAATDAMQARNDRRASHSTLLGRVGDKAYGLFAGQSLAIKEQNKLDYNNKAFDQLKSFKGIVEDEALKQKDAYGVASDGRRYNYSALEAALSRARGSGATTFDYNDGVHSYAGLSVDAFDSNQMNDVKSDQASTYLRDVLAGTKDNGTISNSYEMTKQAAELADIKTFTGTYKSIKTSMGVAKDTATELSTDMKSIKHRANNQANKK